MIRLPEGVLVEVNTAVNNSLPSLPDAPYLGIDSLMERIGARMEPFLYSKMAPPTFSLIDAELAAEFRIAESRCDTLLFTEGAVLTGAKAVKTGDSAIRLAYRTAFYPRPRYEIPPCEYLALGFFGRFDLYVAYQAPMPPTLVARYGNDPGDYESFNPRILGAERAAAYGPQFAEGMARAEFIGVGWRG